MPSLATKFDHDLGPVIIVGFLLKKEGQDVLSRYPALIDTGASMTCISPKIAADLGIVPIGMRYMQSANHLQEVNTYIVSLAMPFGDMALTVPDMEVMEFRPGGNEYHVLIGRDVLRQGHLTVSFDGHLTFSM